MPFQTNAGTFLYLMTSNSYATGITSSTYVGPSGEVFAGGYFRSNMPGTAGASATVCFSGSGVFDACSSLRKFKTNIKPLALGLDAVMQLAPVSYDWKATGEHDIGFIAADTVKVDPVLGEKSTKGELSGVRYGHMTAVLARAIQELKTLFDGLKADDAATTNRLDQMAVELAKLKREVSTLREELAP